VGRSAPDKRLDLAVEIAQKLGIPVDIVGKYDPATIKWLQKQTGVNFIGAIPHNEVLALMETNLALLAPGAESWGLAVVEALQSGMQVYASKFTGVTEWISHPNLHKLSEMNTEIFIREFGLNRPATEVLRIFDDYDIAIKWENFLLKRVN
jgi:glycosyltransferase involved in cell wall biosynthesis